MLPSFLIPEGLQKARQRQQERERKRRLRECVPYEPTMKWERELNLQAATYQPYVRELFPELPAVEIGTINQLDPNQCVDSPCGTWRYSVKRLVRGEILTTCYGRKVGSVLFDDDVRVPALHDRDGARQWRRAPWMSITPMELFSLRCGTRRAKGHVVVAGLGLGHQLIEVSLRKKVGRITLVEREQTLVNWLLPVIRSHMGAHAPLDVVVGDAYEEIPKLDANVVLLDIFRNYGSNYWERDRLVESCRPDQFDYVWAWGAADLEGGSSLW